MSSAQLDIQPLDEAAAESEATLAPFALKQQVAERLAAHRARHGQQAAAPTPSIVRPTAAKPRAAQIAAAVAERYAQSQSYRAFLAAEAERAIQEAHAAAEVAARSAQAIADAQNALLAELDQWELTPPPAPSAPISSPALSSFAPATPPTLSSFAEGGGSAFSLTEPQTQVSSAGLTVRLYEDRNHSIPGPFSGASHNRYHDPFEEIEEEERLALEDEIAFRQSPTFEDRLAPVEIPANLIEFPRQLVASRRARPRIAEGPLREEAEQAHDATQLRIFEVESAQISTAPAAESAESIIPEWSSILLNAQPVSSYVEPETSRLPFSPVLPLHAASPSLRLMAAVVDGCILLAAFLGFVAVCSLTLGKLGVPQLPVQVAAIGSVGVLALMALLYQALFFTFSDTTPGMRYAHIGLCTFNDENPTRAAMRRRILAALLAACPLGIGFLWAWLDDDGLGWHDRISRIYQRSY
ncbi:MULTISPECIES: RDD family protein [Acidobacteriaceae]|uniref:RDD family protein n=1 Tax=Acidobacteriaceae TaxID=204434 RepID=UPI00131BAB76|nr:MULTISPECIES: RDD family protein [Acidobacteriaceae]MDW5264814.1 RDD family protein [Edaphobacter sp.]